MTRRFKSGDWVVALRSYAKINSGDAGEVYEAEPTHVGIIYSVRFIKSGRCVRGLYFDDELDIDKEHYLNKFYETI